ncbi:enoyl-CoA hydratase/isomerase family protein [Stakelama sp. CBK3Z-3]|uniref:Enoyl-CoA hydratase/isomerase family protein n=1 Tax=Stakelama flava TaxID=2860338 RepID=A0ABS6XMZ2_9SPHN|nr:enoyl-CoA hydratase-related protein [Stakelama flava]MBW4331582.1 enoyl-CoA hydratase/isomerase family protein [Stakelama flava]
MNDDPILLREHHEDVLVLTLNRPDRLNAAPPAMFDRLREALGELDGARAVVVQGSGRAFCSGADIGDGSAGTDDPQAAVRNALNDHYNPAIQAIFDLDVPVVTAVQGAAAGIGCSLALAGDFCIAASSAYFLQAFVNIGLVPDGGASWMLPRLVGRSRAIEMMMLGERIPAERALDWGMIHRMVSSDVLEQEALAFAQRLAAGPTVALGLMRRDISYAMDHSLTEAMAHEAESQGIARGTADSAEGAQAFIEKRKPDFRGK